MVGGDKELIRPEYERESRKATRGNPRPAYRGSYAAESPAAPPTHTHPPAELSTKVNAKGKRRRQPLRPPTTDQVPLEADAVSASEAASNSEDEFGFVGRESIYYIPS